MMVVVLVVCKELSKRLDWSARQIERWWRRRRSQGKMSEMRRFRETRSVFTRVCVSVFLSVTSLTVAVLSFVETLHRTYFGTRKVRSSLLVVKIRSIVFFQFSHLNALSMTRFEHHSKKTRLVDILWRLIAQRTLFGAHYTGNIETITAA